MSARSAWLVLVLFGCGAGTASVVREEHAEAPPVALATAEIEPERRGPIGESGVVVVEPGGEWSGDGALDAITGDLVVGAEGELRVAVAFRTSRSSPSAPTRIVVLRHDAGWALERTLPDGSLASTLEWIDADHLAVDGAVYAGDTRIDPPPGELHAYGMLDGALGALVRVVPGEGEPAAHVLLYRRDTDAWAEAGEVVAPPLTDALLPPPSRRGSRAEQVLEHTSFVDGRAVVSWASLRVHAEWQRDWEAVDAYAARVGLAESSGRAFVVTEVVDTLRAPPESRSWHALDVAGETWWVVALGGDRVRTLVARDGTLVDAVEPIELDVVRDVVVRSIESLPGPSPRLAITTNVALTIWTLADGAWSRSGEPLATDVVCCTEAPWVRVAVDAAGDVLALRGVRTVVGEIRDPRVHLDRLGADGRWEPIDALLFRLPPEP